jgi:arylsulfatase A-like enzyme
LSVYGGTVPTPRIDELARDGIRLNNYTVEAQWTPTRSAIMTGRLPVRSGTTRVPLPGEGKSGLAPWEFTLAKLFSDSGYSTAMFGKLHLGEDEGRLPIDQGFDEWFGISLRTAPTRPAIPLTSCSGKWVTRNRRCGKA